jgi:iron complex outermembrane receptor protein
MKPQGLNYFFLQSLLLTTSVVFTIKPVHVVALPIIVAQIPASKQQLLSKNTPIREIQSLNQIEHPLSDAQKLVQSTTPTGQTEVIPVTGVKVNSTDKGLEVILETGVKSDRLQVTPKTEANSYIADIPNAQLRLANGESFRQSKPAAGIAEITVSNVDANNIRLTVTAETGVPTVELFDSDEGLVFGVTSTATTGQQPATSPQQTKPQDNPAIELQVTAPPDTYRVPDNSTGTRTNTPNRDVPQTINVIPRQVIEDQGANRLADALRNAGVIPDVSGQSDNVTIRGFDFYGQNGLKNGLADQTIGTAYGSDVANIERIEVLKGPASVLYGSQQPGGIFNIITKQPLSEPYYSIGGKVGSRSLYESSLDLSGPLTNDKKLLYRLNTDYENSRGFVDNTYTERIFVAPVISWQLGTNTKFTIEGEYLSTRRPNLFGSSLPIKGTLLPNPNGKIPPNTYLGDPTVDKTIQTEGRIGYNLEHKFSENWSLYNSFRYAFNQIFGTAVNPGSSLRADNRTINRSFFVYQPYTAGTYAQDTHVVGKFKTFGIEHQLLVGVDGYHFINAPSEYKLYSFPSIDVYNPIYGYTPGSLIATGSSKTILNQLGVYIQDQLVLADNLKLVIGGREDYEQTKSLSFSQTGQTTASDNSQFAFSPRVGIVYQPIQPISLYASYSRSFQPSYSRDFYNRPFEPTRATQYEVGVKTDLLDNKLSATLALYQLTQTNIGTADLDHPGFSVQIGEARSRGVEFFVTGELAPGWNIIGSYNYTDAQITRDNNGQAGKLLPNAPFNSASIWTNYIFPNGDLKGFGGGLGVFFVGDRFRDTTNTSIEPSFVRTDAALYYRRNNWQAALNFKNLFDVLYYESGTYRGEPFGAELSLKWQF